MRVEIIDNITNIPEFEPQNVFQTKEFMHLFEQEKDANVVFFAVYGDCGLTMLQPVVIQRFVKWLPWRFGAYAVAWREPWRAENIADEEAVEVFNLMHKEIVKYCRKRALYIEYRHFSEKNIYAFTFKLQLPWWNIYREFGSGEDVADKMKRDKKRQLKQSFDAGVEVVLHPTDEQIVEWYALLRRLYRRIHRPLPSLQLFLRLNQSPIGKIILITYQGRVISGSAMFHSSHLTPHSSFFYDWYRASIAEDIEGVYPSVVSTWSALQYASDNGGGLFDFMGAGPQNKPYGVRDFKLKFGGTLTNEYRYRKYLL